VSTVGIRSINRRTLKMTFNGNGNRRAGDAAGHSAGSRGNNNGAEITRRPPKVQVVSAVHGSGSRLAFEPHRESDPALADLDAYEESRRRRRLQSSEAANEAEANSTPQ